MKQTPLMTGRAKTLRVTSTKAEQILWRVLKANQIEGLKFRRQVPIGAYIVDFACLAEKIIIELDGGYHANQVKEDTERTLKLETKGYKVIRFWNNDVLENLDGVLERLKMEIND